MADIYLDNAKQIFTNPPEDVYYEGRDKFEFDTFLHLLGFVLPNRITPEELIVFIRFLINDIRNKKCGFLNSKRFGEIFEEYLKVGDSLDMWMTYLPSFIQAVASPEFNEEFLALFRKSLFQMEDSEEEEHDYGCVEIEPDVIDISNKDKAEVLAALYNHSKPVGMGIVQYDPTPMTVDIARMVLKKMGYSFGYLKGRTMKVNLEGDILYVYGYNRDNDHPGLAQKAISKCRNIDKGKKDDGGLILL